MNRPRARQTLHVKHKLMQKNSIYSILLFFCLFVRIQDVFAQTAKKHRVGLSLGFAYYETRDLLVIYKGIGVPLQLNYSYRGIKNRHHIQISFSSGSLESSLGNSADDLRLILVVELHFSKLEELFINLMAAISE